MPRRTASATAAALSDAQVAQPETAHGDLPFDVCNWPRPPPSGRPAPMAGDPIQLAPETQGVLGRLGATDRGETCMFSPVPRGDRTRRREPHQLPPGRHGLPAAFVAQNQRERILAAVADVCSVAGYAEMSVEDVIVTAGVSRRTFYEHFKNKEDAFLAAYDVVVAQLLVAVQEAYEKEEGFAARVRAGLAAFLEFLTREPAFARMCIVEALAAGPDAVARRNSAMAAFADLLEENARVLGTPIAPQPITAETIVGGIYEVVYTRIVRGDIRQLPELLPDLLYPALLPYEGTEAAVSEYRLIASQ